MSDTSSTTSTSTSSSSTWYSSGTERFLTESERGLCERLGKEYNVAAERIDLDAYNAMMAGYYAQGARC
jgi:hypothetical protein